MCKSLTLALLILASSIRAAVPSISLPLDWTGAAGISRANLNLNPIALRDGSNVAIDSLNLILSVLTGYSNSLALASNQDLILKVDADANGTHKLVVTGNNIDSLFRVNEDGTARLFNSLTLDSSLTVGKRLYLADSLKLTLLTASSPVLALDATKHVIAGTTTGSGSTVVLSSGPTIVNPTWSGTIATGLTASRTLTTDASGNMAVNTETGTGSHVRATSPTTSNLTNTGTLTAASGTFSSTLGVAGLLSLGGGAAFTMAGGGGDGYIWRSSSAGLTMRGIAGSSYDLSFFNPAGNYLIRNPTGTNGLEFPGSGTYSFTGPVSMSSTLGVTGKVTGSDTVAAVLGFRAGNTAASNTILYRSGADMWTTPDSLTVAALRATDSLVGSAGRLSTSLTASYATASTAAEFDANKRLVSVTKTGTGSDVYSNSPTLVTPVIGAATGTSLNLLGNLTADSIVSAKFYEEGSFTTTLRGCASDPTGTAKYIRIGKNVTLTIPYLTCTSDSSGAAMTGLPAAIQPPNDQYIGRPFRENNTIVTESANNSAFIVSGSAVRFYLAGSYTTFFAASSTRSNMPNSTPGTNFIIDYTLQ